jgi:hypothetical protein
MGLALLILKPLSHDWDGNSIANREAIDYGYRQRAQDYPSSQRAKGKGLSGKTISQNL